jgi:alpha-glucosidase
MTTPMTTPMTTSMTWCDMGDDVLAFDRGTAFRCVVNFSADPVALAGQGRVLLASTPYDDGLPADSAAWLLLDASAAG